jgi:two-component system cell cycle sensor histidine kinase/response regulator CckA
MLLAPMDDAARRRGPAIFAVAALVLCLVVLMDPGVVTVIAVAAFLLAGLVAIEIRSRGMASRAALVERGHLEALNALAQVVEASPVVVFQWSAVEEWPVKWVSSNVSRWGYSAEALMRNDPPFKTLIHPDDQAAVIEEVARYTAEGRESFIQEYRIRAANHAVMWIEDRTSVVRDANGRVVRYQGVLTDITERRHLQAQFVQAQKMETVGRLAGGVAHDFNNLLTVINGYAEFALAEVPPDDPLHEMLQEIHDAGTRATTLTRQLLAFSRPQPTQLTRLDCNRVAERMKTLLGRLIGEDVRLTFDLDPALWTVRADEGQIEQTIMNLAINARDAMPEGGSLVVTTRNVLLHEHEDAMTPEVPAGPYVMVAVADSGCGMDEATRAHIFEPFFTTKAVGHGTGLGLSMVHGYVTAAGGSVRVRSAVGHGSTFEIYLPRVEGSIAAPEAAALPARVMRGHETILVVEDEAALRRVAEKILVAAGYTVIAAAAGPEALEALDAQSSVDMVFTDVVMPGMSGPELAAEVLRRRPGMKVLLASGFVREAFPQRAPDGHGFTFIAKPYSPSALTRLVREVLDQA